jgi:hypothetical protein
MPCFCFAKKEEYPAGLWHDFSAYHARLTRELLYLRSIQRCGAPVSGPIDLVVSASGFGVFGSSDLIEKTGMKIEVR